MLIEVKMRVREVIMMSQRMAGFVLASMADPQRKSFRGF